MDSTNSPPVTQFLPTAIILMIIGWGGLYLVTMYTTPTGGTRWLFFFTGVLALTGTALPIVAFFNRRFQTAPPPVTMVIVREAIFIGIYIPTLAWLQIGRILSPFLAMLLAVGLLIIEWLLRLRERSKWNP